MPRPPAKFACGKCHHVRLFLRCALGHSWNHLIFQLTGGLLYGHEVNKPQWLKQERKRVYRPHKPHPAPRREQIEQLLVDTTLSYRQLARQLGLDYATVAVRALRTFKIRGVQNRQELTALLRPEEKKMVG